MSCMHFHRNRRPQDDSSESSDSITYWRKPLGTAYRSSHTIRKTTKS
jgi:hypothetical protein